MSIIKTEAVTAIDGWASGQPHDNNSFTDGINLVTDLINKLQDNDLQTELEKIWLNSFSQDDKLLQAGMQAGAEVASKFSLDSKSFETEQRLVHAIEAAATTIYMVSPLSQEEEDFLSSTVETMKAYKGDNLEVLAEKLTQEADLMRGKGDDMKSSVLTIAANAVVNQLSAPVLNPRDLVAINEPSLGQESVKKDLKQPTEYDKDNTMQNGSLFVQEEAAQNPVAAHAGSSVLESYKQQANDLASTLDDKHDSKEKYKQGISQVASAIDTSKGDIDSVIMMLKTQVSRVHDNDIKSGIEDGISIAEGLSEDVKNENTKAAIASIQYILYEKAGKQHDVLGSKIEEIADSLSNFNGNDLGALARYMSHEAGEKRELAKETKDLDLSAEAAARSVVARAITKEVIELNNDQPLTMQ